jgi:hypothetical protein
MGVKRVSIEGPSSVFGRSWEMACVMAAARKPGFYSGTVEDMSDGVVYFGPVMSLKEKSKLNKIETYFEIPSVLIPGH